MNHTLKLQRYYLRGIIYKISSYLIPGTVAAWVPSTKIHDTLGAGLPTTEHDTVDPVSLLNSNFLGGSCKNFGISVSMAQQSNTETTQSE